MITVTRDDGTNITALKFTAESIWSRDGKLIVHEIPGANGDAYYTNGSTSYSCTLSGRTENTPANNAVLAGCLHKMIEVTSTAQGTHGSALITSVTPGRDPKAWVYFTMVAVL